MKDKTPSVIKFDFQDIDISQIPKLLPPRYRSKYAELRVQIMERINSMDSSKTFVFAPAGGAKVDAKFKESLSVGINQAFAKEHMNWRVGYSEVAKAFVVAPFKRRGGVAHKPASHSNGNSAPVESTQGGFKEDETQRLHKLVRLMKDKLGVTLRQLQEKGNQEYTDHKRAMLYVGRNGMGLKLKAMGDLLGMQSGASTVFCQQALSRPSAKEKVDILVEVLNRG